MVHEEGDVKSNPSQQQSISTHSEVAQSAGIGVEVQGLVKRYGTLVALDHVSFNVKAGELFALLGPNGAGKTTLLHILCTILSPDEGRALIAGADVVQQALRARRRLGVVFQEPSLDDRLTVYENLEFHGLVYGVPAALRRKRIDEMLHVVELSDWRERLVRTLSVGMKRRLEIARALIHDSRVLFLDEPTVGLDAQSRARIWRYLHDLRQQRDLTLIVTTHYIEEVEQADRVAIIDQGKLLAIDTPLALKSAHGHEVLEVSPINAEVRAHILAEYQNKIVKTSEDQLTLKVEDGRFIEHFLSIYGSQVRAMTRIEPSLESVFLSLTGRAIRDQEASARERTLAFGKQGGEHTR